MNPASAATKITNGKNAIRPESATWLAIAQPSSALRWPTESRTTTQLWRARLVPLAPPSAMLSFRAFSRRRQHMMIPPFESKGGLVAPAFDPDHRLLERHRLRRRPHPQAPRLAGVRDLSPGGGRRPSDPG